MGKERHSVLSLVSLAQLIPVHSNLLKPAYNVIDDPDNLELFIPEVKKLFSLTLTLSSLELHTANLDVEIDFLQTFLDTLPSHGEMKAFSLVTARDCPLVFSAISGLLYRNPALQALR